MHEIVLTYRQWMSVHPSFRSMINRVPHVVAYDAGELVLARVVFERTARAAMRRRPSSAQLRLRGV